jgi:hypothetical protein
MKGILVIAYSTNERNAGDTEKLYKFKKVKLKYS